MKTIKIQSSGFSATFSAAKQGDVFVLFIHGCQYPPELRENPPRVRLLEDAHVGHTECELIDTWLDAPDYWPPWSAPGAAPPAAATTTAPAKGKTKTKPAADQGRKSA